MARYMWLVMSFLLDLYWQSSCINVMDLTPVQVTTPLEWLRTYGINKRNSLKKKNLKQYLAIMVLSPEEFNSNPGNWAAVAVSLRQKEGQNDCYKRLVFLENKDKNAQHGEKQLVTSSTCLSDMIATCRADNICTGDTIVVLYTHYIPCSNIYSLSYQCSELLMNWNREHPDVDMVVGYDVIFSEARGGQTNEAKSKWFMEMGTIAYFQYDTELNVFTKPSIYEPTNEQEDTLQNWMYQCLTGIHLKTDSDTNDKDYKDELINHDITCVTGHEMRIMFAYFVNYLMYLCTQNPLLNLDHKEHFRICFHNTIEDQITSGCPRRGVQSGMVKLNRNQINFCAQLAVTRATHLGQPTLMDEYQRQIQLSRAWQRMANYDAAQLGARYVAWRNDWSWVDANIQPDNKVKCANKNEDLKLLCSQRPEPKSVGTKRKGKRPNDKTEKKVKPSKE